MATLRLYRCVEYSIIDYITAQLSADNWVARVEKAFAKVYEGSFPCILINVRSSNLRRKEIGTTNLIEELMVDFRIFADNDGTRLDLAAWLIEKLKVDIDYYTYVITNNVATKTLAGKIISEKFTDNRKEITNIENVDNRDRFRHVISLQCRVALS